MIIDNLDMVICYAPARICLLGEHAIVYGYPSLAAAIDLGAYVSVEAHPRLEISSQLGSGTRANPYVYRSFLEFSRITGIKAARIQVRSQIPIASGLGSSAAVTIATLQALNLEFGSGLSLDQIAELGHRVEMGIQGRASPMDTHTCTHGGIWMFPELKRIPCSDLKFLIGVSSKRSSTKLMLAKVARLRSRPGSKADSIMKCLGILARMAADFLESGDLVNLGRAMDVAHGLLGALGVSNRELDAIANLIRNRCYGAKITGAGGGGCVIGIIKDLRDEYSELERLKIPYLISKVSDRGVVEVDRFG